MNQSGEAADEVVRISLHAAEIALRITGEGQKSWRYCSIPYSASRRKQKGGRG